jgi:hypothetical protein
VGRSGYSTGVRENAKRYVSFQFLLSKSFLPLFFSAGWWFAVGSLLRAMACGENRDY